MSTSARCLVLPCRAGRSHRLRGSHSLHGERAEHAGCRAGRASRRILPARRGPRRGRRWARRQVHGRRIPRRLARGARRRRGRGPAGLKRDIDAWWAAKGWDSRVVLKAHFGRAVVGPFGADARFDVIGNEVNVAATLPARTVSLSAEAFRRLENDRRRAFRKHTGAGRVHPGGRSPALTAWRGKRTNTRGWRSRRQPLRLFLGPDHSGPWSTTGPARRLSTLGAVLTF